MNMVIMRMGFVWNVTGFDLCVGLLYTSEGEWTSKYRHRLFMFES